MQTQDQNTQAINIQGLTEVQVQQLALIAAQMRDPMPAPTEAPAEQYPTKNPDGYDISDFTLEQLSDAMGKGMQLAKMRMSKCGVGGGEATPSIMTAGLQVGSAYFIFTPTFGYLGVVSMAHADGIRLENAVWVAHTGYMVEMAASGKLNVAVTMNTHAVIPTANIVAAIEWMHAIPTESIDQ